MSHKGGVNGQALVQSMLESDVFGDFYKGLFDSHVGLVCGFFFKVQKYEGVKMGQVGEVSRMFGAS